MDKYEARYRQYIQFSVEHALEQAKQANGLLNDETRIQILHVLNYGLRAKETWVTVRDVMLAIAPMMEQAGYRQDWIPYLEEGLLVSREKHDDSARAEFSLQLGILYRMLSDFNSAMKWLSSSIESFILAGDGRGQARAFNELAWVEHLVHHYEDATQHVQDALSLLAPDDPERGMSHRVMGMVAVKQERFDDAEVHHKTALGIFERQNDIRKIAWSLQNLAFTYREQGKPHLSLDFYQQAERMLNQLQDQYAITIVKMNQGITYLDLKQFPEALQSFSDAEMLAEQLHDTLQLAKIHSNRGLVYLDTQDYTRAEISFRESIRIYESLGDKSWALNSTDGLSMAYIGLHQYEKAINVLQTAISQLPLIQDKPLYSYLYDSFQSHLQIAQNGLVSVTSALKQ